MKIRTLRITPTPDLPTPNMPFDDPELDQPASFSTPDEPEKYIGFTERWKNNPKFADRVIDSIKRLRHSETQESVRRLHGSFVLQEAIWELKRAGRR